MENGGTIKVTTDKDEKGLAVVTVRDEGTGIDSDIFPRLFTKVWNQNGYRAWGCIFQKHTWKLIGGKISAENNAGPNPGATFTFTIPLVTDATGRDTQSNVPKPLEEEQRRV